MRITVGGLLIVGAIGGGIGYFLSPASLNSTWLSDKTSGIKDDLHSMMKLFKTGRLEKKTPPVYAPPPPFPEGLNAPTSVEGHTGLKPSTATISILPATNNKQTEVSGAVNPVAVPVQSVEQARPVSKVGGYVRSKPGKRVKFHPRRTYEKKTSGAAVEPYVSALMGKMVALELSSGRTVQGILQAKTATDYKLELPGLGPFSYPLQNVKSIRRAAE